MYGNNVFLTGNLTKDVETAYTQSGKAVSKFSLAWNYKEKAHFFECAAWDLPDFLRDLKKGQKVSIEGSLSQDTWQDKATGGNRSKIVINCSTINVLQGKAAPENAQLPVQAQAVQQTFSGQQVGGPDFETPLGPAPF